MKVHSFLLALSAAGAASAAAVASTIPVSDQEIVETLLRNDGFLLTPSSHRLLEEGSQRLVKRTPQTPTQAAPKQAGSPNLAALLGQLLGGGSSNANKANAPNSSVPEIQDAKAKFWPEAKRRKIRYGPYRIPPTSEKNIVSDILNVQGMSNTLKVGATKPCTGECTILSLFADLEYADGSAAKNSNGAWLHHIVLLNSGPKVVEPNCGTARVENIFMSGNERSISGFALPNATMKSGYKLTPDDKLILNTQLMNMEDKEKWAWVTITYEYLDGAQPGWKQGKTVWMTIGPGLVAASCGPKNVTSPWGPSNLTLSQQPKSDVFTEHSKPWHAPMDAWLLSTGGHMHDGGVSTEIFKNNERICNSVPHYSKVSASHAHGDEAGKTGMGGMGGMGMRNKRQMMGGMPGTGAAGNADIEHIEKQTGCAFYAGMPLKKGDSMYLQVNYDFNKHPGMRNKKGELDEVMGIVGSLVAF